MNQFCFEIISGNGDEKLEDNSKEIKTINRVNKENIKYKI